MGQNIPFHTVEGELLAAGISPDQTKGVFSDARDVLFHGGYIKLLQTPSVVFQTPQRRVQGMLNQPSVLTFGYDGGIGRWEGGINPSLKVVQGTQWKFLPYGAQTLGVNHLGKLWHFSEVDEVSDWREIVLPNKMTNIALHKSFLMGVAEDYVMWGEPDSLTVWDGDTAQFADQRFLRDIGTNVGGILASREHVFVVDGERLWYLVFSPELNNFVGPTLGAQGIGTESKWGLVTAQGLLIGFGRMGAWAFDGEVHRLLMEGRVREEILADLNYNRLDEVVLFHHTDIEVVWFSLPVGDGFRTYGYNYRNNAWTKASFLFTAADNSEIGTRRFFATPQNEIAAFTRNQGTGINELDLQFPVEGAISLGWGYGQWGEFPWGG